MRKLSLSWCLMIFMCLPFAVSASGNPRSTPSTAVPVPAGSSDLLRRFMSDARPAQASFTQQDEHGLSSGVVAVGSSGRLRWEQKTPFALLLVSNGKTAWQVDTDLMQATRLDARMAEGWASVFGDRPALERDYLIEQQGNRLVFTPKRQDGVKATIDFDGDGNPSTIRMGSAMAGKNDKSTTQIKFTHWTRLDARKQGLFDYAPSKGMDVVGAN